MVKITMFLRKHMQQQMRKKLEKENKNKTNIF